MVFSEEIRQIQTFYDFRKNYYQNHEQTPPGQGHETRFAAAFIEKLRQFDNLRAFASILVSTVVFAENDLKEDHLVFDGEGRLTRIDFDQCFFMAGLNFNLDDLENLPLVSDSNSGFKPYNLIFNYSGDRLDPEKRKIGEEIKKQLPPEFKNYVYEAILKILLMPDFIHEEISRDVKLCSRIISGREIELAQQKKLKLFSCMMKSEGFREFLRLNGQKAKGIILSEIESFREYNSHFRKKWSGRVFHDQCVKGVNRTYLMLRIKVFIKTRLARNLIIGLGIFLLLAAAATAVLFFPPAGLTLPFVMGSLPLLAKSLMVAGAGLVAMVGIVLSLFLPNVKAGAVKMPSPAHPTPQTLGLDAALPAAVIPHSSPAPTRLIMDAVDGQLVVASHRSPSMCALLPPSGVVAPAVVEEEDDEEADLSSGLSSGHSSLSTSF